MLLFFESRKYEYTDSYQLVFLAKCFIQCLAYPLAFVFAALIGRKSFAGIAPLAAFWIRNHHLVLQKGDEDTF
jgi:hypothetical protein